MTAKIIAQVITRNVFYGVMDFSMETDLRKKKNLRLILGVRSDIHRHAQNV